VALSWQNPGDLDFAAVRVVRTIGAPASTPDDGVNVYEGNGTKTDATGLTNGTAYTFTAFARDGDGNWSEGSTPVTATPVAKPPSPPAGPPAGSPSQPKPNAPPATGGTSKPPTSVAKPAFGAKTLVNMSVAARRIRGSSPIKVVLRNANGFQVSGRLSARASKRASGSRAFLVGSKSKATITLRLSKSLRQFLKRKGKLSLRLTATVKDPAGGTRTVKKTVSLRLKTARR
jgi:hypothetical protein